METIKILPIDTAESIFLRMAVKLNSIPKYLYMENVPILEGRKEDRLGQQSIIDFKKIVKNPTLKTPVIDLFNRIRKDGDTKSFATFIKTVIIHFPNLSLENDIIKPWLYYHVSTDNLDDDSIGLMIFGAVTVINKILGVASDIRIFDFKNDKKNSIDGFNNTMTAIVAKNKSNLDAYIEVESVEYTDFELEKFKWGIQISENYMFTLQEIFDLIILSEEFPFSNLYIDGENYYKIYKNTTPYMEWSDLIDSSTIILKFLTDKVKKIINVDGSEEGTQQIYDDISVIMSDGKCIVLLEVENSNKDIVVEKVLNVFQKQLTPDIYMESVSLRGVFYIPKESINYYIFSHMVMNDINFSKFVIDEARKPTKATPGINVLYLNEDSNPANTVSIVLTSKLKDRFDPNMIDKPANLFPENGPYIRIRVTAKTIDMIYEIQRNIGRIVALYNYKFKSVLELYIKYIPDFKVDVLQPLKNTGKKSTKQSDKRQCKHSPITINQEDAGNYEDTMIFPLPNDPINKGVGRLYACEKVDAENKKDLIFPGLQLRKESGNYNPCCYKQNQKEKSGSDYNKYLKFIETGEKMKKNIGKKQQRLIKTNKILDYTDISDHFIYDTVGQLFEFIKNPNPSPNPSPNISYFRSGVFRSKMSMIGSLLEVVRKKGEVITEDSLLTTKKIIANTPSLLSLCKQALPTKTIGEIRDYILRDDTYVDPRIFTDVLEEYFKCRIYTFNENGMVLPNYKKNYLKYNDYDTRERVVVLIEHFGAESDHATIPQCEFISFSINEGDLEYSFSKDSVIATFLNGVFNRMTRCYFLNTKVVPVTLNFYPSGQKFDSFGKVCAFEFTDENSGRYIAFTKRPFPPLPIDELNMIMCTKPTIETVRKLFKGYHNKSHNKSHNVFETDDFIIPLTGTSDETDIVLPQIQESILTEFSMYSKLAKYITEYFFYAYSRYISNESLVIGNESIEQFINNGVTIVGDQYKYGDISKSFSEDNSIYSGGIIRLTSAEIGLRCVYLLKLAVARNPGKIIAYKDRQNILSVIDNVNDYKSYPTQVILFGHDTLQRYIMEFFAPQEISYNIGFDGATPHYYKFEDKIYLSQNILPMQNDVKRTSYWREPSNDNVVDPREGFDRAMNVCNNWKKNGVNIDTNTNISKDGDDISIYKYSRDTDDFKDDSITQLNDGVNTKQKIFAYKIKGVPKYTALLNLSKIKN